MKISTFNRALAFTALASSLVLTGCQKEELMADQLTPTETLQATNNGQLIEGQYIVVFKDGSVNVASATTGSTSGISSQLRAAAIRHSLMAKAGIQNNELKETFQGSVKGFAARLSAEQLRTLRTSPEVAYIEQDRIIALGKPAKETTTPVSSKGKKTTTTEPAPTEPAPTPTQPTTPPVTDTYTTITPLAGETVPWNVSRVGYGDGTGKTVWVIDTGVKTDHPDLTVDVARSKSFVPGITSAEDGNGHGTSVAGVIAAKNNGSGLLGVAAGATVVALRVFDDAGNGTVSNVIAAVSHVETYAKAGDVVNLSLGGGISTTLDNAVISAASKGILFAVAAGNSAIDCENMSPARVAATGVYTISAMDSYARLWDKSNYGLNVAFAAPGVGVTAINRVGTTSSCNGTSFAAPHVAGVLLLRGKVFSNGTITGDKDSKPDPIASVK